MTTAGPTDAPDATRRRRRAAVWTWLAAGVVVALVGTLVLVKVAQSGSLPRTTTSQTATSPTVLRQLTSIPSSVFDTVGVTSSAVPITSPHAVDGLRHLDFTSASGRRLPGVLFIGTEFCSFCAAERWALIAALSRFGKFEGLYDMDSSSLDFAPSTPSFTFNGVAYRSDYVVFRGYEVRSDVQTTEGYARLMVLPARLRALERSLSGGEGYPFVDIANVVVASQAAFSPLALSGLSRDEIATALSHPANPITKAIVASANYLTASICAADGQQPPEVCTSAGVTGADGVLGLAR